MELRRYLAIVRAHWALSAVAFGVTLLMTLYLVMPQPWIYESTGSLRVSPSDDITAQDDLIDAWANLSDPRVTTTYATLIQSDLITEKAEATLPETSDTQGLKVDTQVLIDTTIITVTSTGQDAETVRDMTDAVMTQAVAYADAGDTTYQLERVDEPSLPDNPVGPNKNLQLILGLLFGAILAIAVALFAEYVKRPLEDYTITDPATGASNETYLRHRLREETAATVRTDQPFVVATLRVEVRTGENDDMAHVPPDRELRRIARGLRLTIPDDAVLAYVGGGLFVALIPNMQGAEIDQTVGGWAAAVGALLDWSSHGELNRRLQLTSGLCEFRGATATGTPSVERLVARLVAGTGLEGSMDEAPPEADAGVEAEAEAKAPAPAPSPAYGPAPAPGPAPAKVEPKAEAVVVPTTEASPAMPPAPARKTVKPGNARPKGNGAPAKKQIRRVTVLPDIEDLRERGDGDPTRAAGDPARAGGDPARAAGETGPTDGDAAAPAAAGAAKGTASPAKGAGQEKGDAGDPPG